jgi:hypothetical protein
VFRIEVRSDGVPAVRLERMVLKRVPSALRLPLTCTRDHESKWPSVSGRDVAAFLFKQTVTSITFVTAIHDIALIA